MIDDDEIILVKQVKMVITEVILETQYFTYVNVGFIMTATSAVHFLISLYFIVFY